MIKLVSMLVVICLISACLTISSPTLKQKSKGRIIGYKTTDPSISTFCIFWPDRCESIAIRREARSFVPGRNSDESKKGRIIGYRTTDPSTSTFCILWPERCRGIAIRRPPQSSFYPSMSLSNV